MKKQFNISLDEDVIERINVMCESGGLSASGLIANLVRERPVVYDKEISLLIRKARPELVSDSLVINTALHNFFSFITRFPGSRPNIPVPEIELGQTMSDGTPLPDTGILESTDIQYVKE